MMRRKIVLVACLIMCSAMVAIAQIVDKKSAGDGQRKNDLVMLVKKYQMRMEGDLNKTSMEELLPLLNWLRKMESVNVERTREMIERRHQQNATIVALRQTIKGKDGSKKYQKSLEKMVGENMVQQTMSVIAQAEREEAFYPTYVAVLENLEKEIDERLAQRRFPTGKLKSLSYMYSMPMRPFRCEIELTTDSQGRHVLRMMSTDYGQSGVPNNDGTIEMSKEMFVSDEVLQEISRIMEKEHMERLPEERSEFPYVLHDGGSYSLRAYFEGGRISSSGSGSLSGMRKIEEYVKRLFTEVK